MSSILTNSSAMVALQTLKTINKGLAATQGEISTGKRVATAKDNAVMWAISSVMNSDVNGFAAVSESLSLGDATVAVARDGAETVVDLLNQMKAKIVAAQEENVDRAKIQADVAQLKNQIQATVDASQFNGLNLLKYSSTNDQVNILGSLNRSASGVSTSSITVNNVGLGTVADVGGVTDTLISLVAGAPGNNAAATFTVDAKNVTVGTVFRLSADEDLTSAVSYTVTAQDIFDPAKASENIASNIVAAFDTAAGVIGAGTVGTAAQQEALAIARTGSTITITRGAAAGTSIIAVDLQKGAARTESFNTGAAQAFAAIDDTATGEQALIKGSVVTLTVADVTAQYTVTEADAALAAGSRDDAIATGIATAMNTALTKAGIADVSVAATTGALAVTNGRTTAVSATLTTGNSKLSAVGAYDVSTATGAATALGSIDGMIQAAIDAAASFGTAQKRIETQSSFISKVSDSFKSGIGALVDADMEAASAKLQALQVQQQLGVQALSIANQSPQNILALFR